MWLQLGGLGMKDGWLVEWEAAEAVGSTARWNRDAPGWGRTGELGETGCILGWWGIWLNPGIWANPPNLRRGPRYLG